MRHKILFLPLLGFLLAGCSVISKEIRQEVDRGVTLPMVQADPDAFKGKKVIWGGIIVSSKNLPDKTIIEVLQTPLDARDRVTDKELSQGRFFVESSKYLDTFVYRTGKEITVAGVIKGVTTQKIGERDYTYPVLESLEIHIFEPWRPEFIYEPPSPWWDYPSYPTR